MKIQIQSCRWFQGRVVKALNHINKLERESNRKWWWIEEVRRKGFMRSLESTLLIQRLVNQRIEHVATRLPVNLSLNRSMTSSAGWKDFSQKLMVYGDTAMCCVVYKFIEVNSLMLPIFSFYPPPDTHTLHLWKHRLWYTEYQSKCLWVKNGASPRMQFNVTSTILFVSIAHRTGDSR